MWDIRSRRWPIHPRGFCERVGPGPRAIRNSEYQLFDKLEKVPPSGTYQLGSVLAKGKRVTVEPSDAEEALLWKMCSKLIHPSSWVINHPADTIHNTYQRQILAVHVVFYG
jgi:hypothetical protein